MINPATRRKFFVINRYGQRGWISRERTAEEVKHIRTTNTNHPNTYDNDREAASAIGVKLG